MQDVNGSFPGDNKIIVVFVLGKSFLLEKKWFEFFDQF